MVSVAVIKATEINMKVRVVKINYNILFILIKIQNYIITYTTSKCKQNYIKFDGENSSVKTIYLYDYVCSFANYN